MYIGIQMHIGIYIYMYAHDCKYLLETIHHFQTIYLHITYSTYIYIYIEVYHHDPSCTVAVNYCSSNQR